MTGDLPSRGFEDGRMEIHIGFGCRRRHERHVVERGQQDAAVEGIEMNQPVELGVASGSGFAAILRSLGSEEILDAAAEPSDVPRQAVPLDRTRDTCPRTAPRARSCARTPRRSAPRRASRASRPATARSRRPSRRCLRRRPARLAVAAPRAVPQPRARTRTRRPGCRRRSPSRRSTCPARDRVPRCSRPAPHRACASRR